MSILEEIFAHKRREIAARKQVKPLPEVRRAAERSRPPLDFVKALRTNTENRPNGAQSVVHPHATPALIAEVKKASPSRGVLCPDFDPLTLARMYAENGAAAISVLTDEKYFQGHLDFLSQIAKTLPHLPVLRKDFICDDYQVYEARAAGADAVLLIVAGLEHQTLFRLHTLTRELGMTPLVEVHNLEELHIALACEPVLIGINNRDLHDFSVNLETTFRLRPHIPALVCVVSESGIHRVEDAHALAKAGVDAILVGEALVIAGDVAAKVRELAGREEREDRSNVECAM